jgi:uncharacterized protein YxeA
MNDLFLYTVLQKNSPRNGRPALGLHIRNREQSTGRTEYPKNGHKRTYQFAATAKVSEENYVLGEIEFRRVYNSDNAQ